MKINYWSLVFLLCLQLISEQQCWAGEKVQLALNWKAEPQFGGFYQSQIDASSQKSALDAEILQGGSGTPTIQMLANDKVDFAIVSAEEILLNNDHNPEKTIVGVFAVFQTNPQVLICRPETQLKSIADIFASTVTVSLQSGLSYFQFLKKKYPLAKARFVPDIGGISTFLNEKKFCQQGFATSEPLLIESKGIHPKTFLISDEGFNPYTTVLAVRMETLMNRPKLVSKFVNQVRAGWIHYLRSPEAANKVMEQLNKSMDAETFARSAAAQEPLIEGSSAHAESVGNMTESRWSDLIKQLKSIGLVKRDLVAREQFQNY
jgi:NitT/TauT family transport system substrate-binding protein